MWGKPSGRKANSQRDSRSARLQSHATAVDPACHAGGRNCEALGLQPTEQVYRVQCLRYIDGEPAAIETTHLPAQLFPQIETRDLEHQSLYLIIENIYSRRLERCEEHIGAVTAGHEE